MQRKITIHRIGETMERIKKKLVLEDGSVFEGLSFGADTDKLSEVVFNTSMVGYQEIMSDPSYTDQAVVMTFPLIGNYGINDGDFEARRPGLNAFIVRDYCDTPSHHESVEQLEDTMRRYDITGISGVDTRQLTRIIREKGSLKALITGVDTPDSECLRLISNYNYKTDGVKRASHRDKEIYAKENARYRIVAIDCGMKMNIVKCLNDRGASVTVVPFDTPAEEIERLHPDGIFISNGPGDPTDAKEAIETIKALKGKYPIFGICLGHQIISLAYGAKTYKLKFGHRGGNHPVKNLETGRIEITSQNHSYAVDSESLKGTGLTATHINLLDRTIEGVESKADSVFSVQFHPESAPGPNDSRYLFDKFFGLIDKHLKEDKENA